MNHRVGETAGFTKEYWDKNYADPEEMDCIGNVEQHVGYLKNLFALEYIDISSVIDFGFGLGYLFKGVLKEFLPYRAHGIEPSRHAFRQVKKSNIKPVDSMNLKLENIDLLSWCKKKDGIKRFDLGICTSVFQYLTDDEIEQVLPVMASRVKYLYLSVPTDKELKRQISDLDFYDEYAIRRSRSKYLKMIKKHFTIVSSRLLESKVHFDEESTSFTDLLYRF